VNIAKNLINSTLRKQHTWVHNLDFFFEVLSFGSMVFAIVVLAQVDSIPLVDFSYEIAYVVVVGLTQLHLVAVCLLIVLSPLLCIGLLFFCCCCKSKEGGQDLYIDVEAREATNGDIVSAGGDCSICYMSIDLNSKIFVLPCS
jgi:hypothetical protein